MSLPSATRCRALSLDRAERETAHEIALRTGGEEENRDDHDRADRGHLAPTKELIRYKPRHDHRDRLGIERRQDRRVEQLVPCVDEGEYRGHRETREGKRQDDLPEPLPERTSVDDRRLLDIGWEILEEPKHQPDHERQPAGDIGEDEGQMGIPELKV